MRKYLTLLTAVVLVSALTGCSSGNNSGAESGDSSQVSSSDVQTNTASETSTEQTTAAETTEAATSTAQTTSAASLQTSAASTVSGTETTVVTTAAGNSEKAEFQYNSDGAVEFSGDPAAQNEDTLIAAAQAVYDAACQQQYRFTVGSPYTLDHETYVENDMGWQFYLVTDENINSLADVEADYDKIFKNEIITDLIKVLGCGVEVNTGKKKDLSAFNLDNLRWNKVVICTDADVDGFQIRTLILTMLYRLTPTLIEKGYVYIAESPLFEITTKDKTYFAYDEPEKDKILKMIGDKSFTIQRSKGLGENEADMMSLTTMNPETRRLIKVNPDDVEMTQWMFNMLLGDDLAGRKEFITNNGADYLEMADIS